MLIQAPLRSYRRFECQSRLRWGVIAASNADPSSVRHSIGDHPFNIHFQSQVLTVEILAVIILNAIVDIDYPVYNIDNEMR